MTLSESWDKSLCWAITDNRTPKESTQQVKAACQHADIVDHVQQGRGGLGVGQSSENWSSRKSGVRKRQQDVQRLSLKQNRGLKLKWESIGKRKISWKELWGMEASRISFLLRATYDVLPSPKNIQQWLNEDPSCPLCSTPATLRHILTGCKISLSQGTYTRRQPGTQMLCSKENCYTLKKWFRGPVSTT